MQEKQQLSMHDGVFLHVHIIVLENQNQNLL